MKRMILMSTLLLATPASHAVDIATEAWNAPRRQTLNAAPDLRNQAQRMLEKLLPDADLVPPAVGEAHFVDLDNDGQLELLATVDYSGRAFFNNVVVVRQQQGRLHWTQTRNNGHSIQDLGSHLVDANGDGRPELVLERFIDRYEGAQRVPTETVVYRWQAPGFRDDSDAFPDYYRRKVIPELERKLAKASGQPSTSIRTDDYEAFALKAELARARQRGKVK